MRITIDETGCIGCGMCAAAAPEVFRLEGHVSTVIAQPTQSWAAFDAAGGCPVNAITIVR